MKRGFDRGFDIVWGADYEKLLLGFEFPDRSVVLWLGPFHVWVMW